VRNQSTYLLCISNRSAWDFRCIACGALYFYVYVYVYFCFYFILFYFPTSRRGLRKEMMEKRSQAWPGHRGVGSASVELSPGLEGRTTTNLHT